MQKNYRWCEWNALRESPSQLLSGSQEVFWSLAISSGSAQDSKIRTGLNCGIPRILASSRAEPFFRRSGGSCTYRHRLKKQTDPLPDSGVKSCSVITLPHGGTQFNQHDLVDYIRSFKPQRDYIIIGKEQTVLARHRKKMSLDYWLRQQSRYQDTMQAVDSVIDALVTTGLFARDKRLCPESRRDCNALRLT
jgi:hypothetical protein